MDTRRRLASARTRFERLVRERIAIDTRSLAAFRIAVGLLLLVDLALRARNLEAFYTDDGVLSREALLTWSDPLHLSIHALSGEAWFQAVLFLVAAAFALALLVGYRTSLATLGSWLLLVSLHNRNGLVLNGGDVILRLLLFFAIFLPLAERWSVDAERSDRRRPEVASVASAALLLQVVVMYTANGAFKLSGDVWLRGDGLEYVFSLGQFTLAAGEFLAAYPSVLTALDYLWLVMVVSSILLIVLTGVPRAVFASLFVGMHVGMALTMRLGLFPLISVASILPFLPGAFWDAVLPRLSRYRPVRAIRRWPERLAAVLPIVTVSGVPVWLRRWHGRLATAIPLVFVVLVLLWNLQGFDVEREYGHDPVPDGVEPVVELTRTDQTWTMFAPDPLSVDGWLVAPGAFANGSRVDAFHGGAVTWDRPPDVSSTYPTARWRKYVASLWRYDTRNRERFAEYLCWRWDGTHEAGLRNVSVYYVEQHTRLDGGPEPTERVLLADVDC